MFAQDLFPFPRGLIVTSIAFSADTIVVAAQSIASSDAGPDCGTHSGRIHS